MTFYPASFVLIAIWLVRSWRDVDNGIPVTIAALPFGMFAAIQIGGLSILALHLLTMLTVSLLFLRWVSQGATMNRHHYAPAVLFLVFYALYAVFSSTILVRLFAGEFLVFPMNVTDTGTAVSIFFPSTMRLLAPGMSNIAQSLYIVLSCLFFIACLGLFVRRSPRIGEIGLVWAASLNVVLGLLDMASLDELLSVIRTADYTLANQHTMGGFARIIGGFSEASGYGAASAAFFGYFMMSFLVGRQALHGGLALANLAAAILSFSSTGLVSVVAACLVILMHLGVYFRSGMSHGFGHWFVIGLASVMGLLTLTLLVPGVTEKVNDILDGLLFSKRGTLSGMERGAWASAGFDAFVQTWGLGAGAGSLRANGMASVVLGSVGLPGALAFIGFLVSTIGGSPGFRSTEDRRMFYAARVLALTLLAALMLAATTPDPTLFLMVATSIAAAVRLRAAMALPRAGVPAQAF